LHEEEMAYHRHMSTEPIELNAELVAEFRELVGPARVAESTVVATAVRLGSALIATSDPKDLRALAADHPNVKVWSLNELS
jgi:hypothetical protein